MGLHFALEECLDTLFGERHALGVAQLGVGLGVAILVAANGRGLVALGKRREDGLVDRAGELDAGLLRSGLERALELVAVLEERAGSMRRSLRIASCRARPSACSFAPAAPFFFDCASA